MATAGSKGNFWHQGLSRDRSSWARIALAGCTAVAAAAGTVTPAAAATPASAAAPQAVRTLVVRNLRDAGPGSLRAAISTANTSAASRIVFSVRGTIRLARSLPAIHRRVTIDATTAPGYHGGRPVVAINFHRHLGLIFGPGAGGSSLLGVAVDRAMPGSPWSPGTSR